MVTGIFGVIRHCRCHSFLSEPICYQQECIEVGCVPSAAVAVRGGGVCPEDVSRGGLPWGGVHPPVDRMTDACENITFPQLLLRTVITTDSFPIGK